MWELKQQLSHGRISLRRFSLFTHALVMAVFAVLTVFSQSAFAESAIRTLDGTSVTFKEHTYAVLKKEQIPPALLKADAETSGYGYFDTSNPSQSKAYLILTTGVAQTAKTGQYVVYDYAPPNTYTNGTNPESVMFETEAIGSGSGVSNCSNSETAAIGWIICPVVTFLAKGMDVMYKIVTYFLEVRTITGNTESTLYKMWVLVRDIANICFVIGFLFIIFSQLTGLGINNYGIKSTLPRLVIAAVLVNISYTVCALAVDASNLLGHSIHAMFTNLLNSFNTGDQYNTATGQVPTWQTIATVILSGGGLAAASLGLPVLAANVYMSGIYMFAPIVVTCIVALLVALLILAARQALIVILIIIAPLAFVAYLLPNTEKYFDKWRDSFLTMILLFPIFSVVFSGAQLAGLAIVQNAGHEPILGFTMIILGMAVQVAPLFITPLLLKFSGSLLTRVAGIVNNPNKGLIDRTRRWAEGRQGERRNRILAEHNNKTRKNPLRNMGVDLDTRRRRIEGRRKYYEAQAENRFDETVAGQNLKAKMAHAANEKVRIDNVYAASGRGMNLELTSRNYASQKQEIENRMLDSEQGRLLTYRQKAADIEKTNIATRFEESDLGEKAYESSRRADANKQRVENTHQATWDTDIQINPELKSLELNRKQSEYLAAQAKESLEKMHTEIRAQGDESTHVINLRDASAETQEHVLDLARSIKATTTDTRFTTYGKAQAERQIAENTASALKETAKGLDGDVHSTIHTVTDVHGNVQNIVEYAAGIKGEVGRRSVVAQARTEASKFMMDDIKNIEATVDGNIASDPELIFKKFTESKTEAERIAYTSLLAKRGSPGAKRLKTVMQEMDDRFAKGEITRDEYNDYKELTIAQNSNILGIGKDVEFYFTNAAYDVDDPDPALAGKIKTFDQITNDVGTWANLSAEAFSKMNMINQLHGLKILAHKKPEKYTSLVTSVVNSPTAFANLKDNVVESITQHDKSGKIKRDKMGNILIIPPDSEKWSSGPYNTPSLSELTDFEKHALFEPPRTEFEGRPDSGGAGATGRDTDYWIHKYENALKDVQDIFLAAEKRGVKFPGVDYDDLHAKRGTTPPEP